MWRITVIFVADSISHVIINVTNKVSEIDIMRHETTLIKINPIPSDRDYGSLFETKLVADLLQAT